MFELLLKIQIKKKLYLHASNKYSSCNSIRFNTRSHLIDHNLFLDTGLSSLSHVSLITVLLFETLSRKQIQWSFGNWNWLVIVVSTRRSDLLFVFDYFFSEIVYIVLRMHVITDK